MHWQRLEREQPTFAALGRELLVDPGVAFVATLRRDGQPRLTTCRPLLWNGDIWLGLSPDSTTAVDLLRDARVLLHSIVTSRDVADGELKVRGTAKQRTAESLLAGFADEAAARWGRRPEPEALSLFRLDIEDVTYVRSLVPEGQFSGDQHVVRWPAAEEFVRHSSGEKEPHQELLLDEEQLASIRQAQSDSEAANPGVHVGAHIGDEGSAPDTTASSASEE